MSCSGVPRPWSSPLQTGSKGLWAIVWLVGCVSCLGLECIRIYKTTDHCCCAHIVNNVHENTPVYLIVAPVYTVYSSMLGCIQLFLAAQVTIELAFRILLLCIQLTILHATSRWSAFWWSSRHACCIWFLVCGDVAMAHRDRNGWKSGTGGSSKRRMASWRGGTGSRCTRANYGMQTRTPRGRAKRKRERGGGEGAGVGGPAVLLLPSMKA